MHKRIKQLDFVQKLLKRANTFYMRWPYISFQPLVPSCVPQRTQIYTEHKRFIHIKNIGQLCYYCRKSFRFLLQIGNIFFFVSPSWHTLQMSIHSFFPLNVTRQVSQVYNYRILNYTITVEKVFRYRCKSRILYLWRMYICILCCNIIYSSVFFYSHWPATRNASNQTLNEYIESWNHCEPFML